MPQGKGRGNMAFYGWFGQTAQGGFPECRMVERSPLDLVQAGQIEPMQVAFSHLNG
jgi:hypothetical protein